MEFTNEIAPFFWVEHDKSASVCLNAGEYLQEIFDTRAHEGFEGSGALREFIRRFKGACENKALILDLFGRAELD